MDDMFVPKFPHLHPGLAISVLVSAEKQDMPESIGVKVYINEKLLMEIPTEFTSKMHATPTSGTPIEGLPNVTRIRTFFRTPPLLIDAPSALRVRVSAGDVVLRTAVLNISQAPES